ncbi:lipopolysaccharide assembly protein LapB [Derxia gummosa]|uniref:Lipopolysaccharide assembly protein B n=1 Tax=Derxia gummosa DSM 723 TaxID=1121388 RepID=A0A8B6X329_9BURK|nr:lipopolysaccharide assembly protein LapB [Derxia gummosa]
MDAQQLLLLAVPAAFIAFGLGWLAARVDIKHLIEGSKSLPRSYFRGLNFLLNEQPDRAIDSFIEAVQGDPETVELHFTLGAMFRRRGETERAIRIHQSLLDRADLAQADRDKALLELGRDFLKAGMFDRAEDAFQKLRGSSVEAEALRDLLDIFEIEKEWVKAIDCARELEMRAGADMTGRIAHYHCELAQFAIMQSRFDEAGREISAAFAAMRHSVRAGILAGELALAAGDVEDAIAAWAALGRQNPHHVALVAEKLMAAYKRLGRDDDGLRMLEGSLAQSASYDVLVIVARETLAREGADAAFALLLRELRRSPTLIGLEQLVQARFAQMPADLAGELDIVKTLLHHQTRRLSRYVCTRCGFKSSRHHWHCPGCRNWDSYPPRRAEELDITS